MRIPIKTSVSWPQLIRKPFYAHVLRRFLKLMHYFCNAVGDFVPFRFSVPFGGIQMTQVNVVETLIKPLTCKTSDIEVRIIWLRLWHPSVVAWTLDIMIGQSVAAWLIKMSSGHTIDKSRGEVSIGARHNWKCFLAYNFFFFFFIF